MGTDGTREPADKRNTYPRSVLALCICTNPLILLQILISQNIANIASGNTEKKPQNNLDVDLAPAVE